MPSLSDLIDRRPTRIGGLNEPAPLRGPARLPWWALPAALIALLSLGLLAWAGIQHLQHPQQIADVALTGERSPAGLDVVLLLDESGSFAAYENVRREAIDQLINWAPQNLRPNDTVTIIGFTDGAATRLDTITVEDLRNEPLELGTASSGSGGTSILPSLEEAAATVSDSGHPRTVIAVTDTIVSDANPQTAQELISELQASSMSVITPTGVGVTGEWDNMFAWEHVLTANPDSSGSTSLAIAKALAHATGQHVERV